MADAEQLKVLLQGGSAWNKWRKANPAITSPDLTDADIRELDLSLYDLSGADLAGARLQGGMLTVTNLRGAKLRRTIISHCAIDDADFEDADLSEAAFQRTDIDGGNFRRTKLHGTDLTYAHIRFADFREADFSRADLSYATLCEMELKGANFAGAVFGCTALSGLDLSQARGLEDADFFIPSSIGIDTIERSKGGIPKTFLQGCGLSDLAIEYAALAASGLDPDQASRITREMRDLYVGTGIRYYSCFISYNNRDNVFAERLYRDLQNNGVRCWFAAEDMKTGDIIRASIGQEVRLRDKLLVILSESSIGSQWVGHEVEKAFAEERDRGTVKLFPIRLDDAALSAKDDWVEAIRLSRHIGDFSDWKAETKYQEALQRLLRDLKASSTV
jgi:uncharacterized protein YjbI with pentapeptide repeats